MSNKLAEYKDRHKEWRDISISQLSMVNNILLTLSSGLFVVCINAKTEKINFNLCYPLNLQATTYYLSILLLCASIFYGHGVLISRLYDFRISRHIALTRQRFYKANENTNKKELSYSEFSEFSIADRFNALFFCVFYKLPFINSDDAKKVLGNKKLEYDFQTLRKTVHILGSITWRWTKIQIGLFLASGVIYLINKIISQ